MLVSSEKNVVVPSKHSSFGGLPPEYVKELSEIHARTKLAFERIPRIVAELIGA